MTKTYFAILFYLITIKVLSQNDSIKEYNSNGILIKKGQYVWIQDGEFKLREQSGEWKYYDDETGKLKKIENFKNGRLDGAYLEYYSNGVIKIKGQYNYKLVQIRKTRDKDGSIMKTSIAKQAGTWEYYDSTGRIEKRVTYSKKGKKIKEEKF